MKNGILQLLKKKRLINVTNEKAGDFGYGCSHTDKNG